VDTSVAVSWDVVDGANVYQVESTCTLADGSQLEPKSAWPDTPPVSVTVDSCIAFDIHVRAVEAPKHEGNPVQSGKKGDWSAECHVEIAAP
jgi:hypothetical protein